MAKMGRPPKSGSDALRDARIYMRVTQAEKDELLRLAGIAGMSITTFLLSRALGDRLGGVLLGEGFTSSEEARKRREGQK